MHNLKKFSPSSILVILLAIFTIVNPAAGLDVLAFLAIAFIILQKIFGEYFILVLLVTRPTLDYWRDSYLFSFNSFDLNINAALSIFLLVWTAYFFAKNSSYVKTIPAKTAWLAFIAWCSITAIYSYDTGSTVIETVKAANMFGLFGICYIMSKKDPVKFKKDFLKALIAASTIPLLVAVFQFLSKTGMDIDGIANRIYGTFAHPNILATFTLLLATVLVNEFFITKDLRNMGAAPKWVCLFLLAIIALTYTRIAWIGVAALFIIVGLIYYKKILLYLLGGAALFFILFYPLNNYLATNFNLNLQSIGLISRLTARNEDSDSVKWRTDVANKVLPLFTKKPILGYGYGSFPKVWDDNKDISNIWDNTSEAHNDYIKVAFEAGIIGLILFLSIFLSLLYNQISFAVKNKWKNIAFIASILVYLILGLSDNMLHHTPMVWWLWAVWGWWAAEYRLNSEK
ncbi:MAG: O-antigen polymerase [Parcubacteria group bacterium Gr01-1014_13]|nr:MAG: O-antigen polymerase [Parcubacteria group bacterium Gr01-1014_13]